MPTLSTESPGLRGLRVAAFESRRRGETAALIRRHGGTPQVVPALREVPSPSNRLAEVFCDRLMGGEVGVMVFFTGTVLGSLMSALGKKHSRAAVLRADRNVNLAARGPKTLRDLKAL